MVSTKHQKEYDLFGPWILEVKEIDEVPDAFLPVYPEGGDIDLAFKIPRHVERRNANPGEDLYDYMVILRSEALEIHRRRDDGLSSSVVLYEKIGGIKIRFDLLLGEVTIYHADGSVSFSFNTVSEDLIETLVAMLRKRYPVGKGTPLPPDAVDIDELTHHYRVLSNRERKDASVSILAFRDDLLIEKREKTIWDRGLDVIRRPRVRPTMTLATETELILYRGEPQIVRFNKGNYGYSRTLIPRSAIRDITIDPDTVYLGCVRVRIVIPGHDIVMFTEDGFPVDAVVPAGERS